MFQNRREAGKYLARKLLRFKNSTDSVVLALPRGGVLVGAEIARDLNLPLDILAVKKLSHPFNSELAIGAVGPNEEKYIDWEMVKRTNIDSDYLEKEIREKLGEVRVRVKKYNIDTSDLLQYRNFLITDY